MAAIQVRIPLSGPGLISNHSLIYIQVLKCMWGCLLKTMTLDRDSNLETGHLLEATEC